MLNALNFIIENKKRRTETLCIQDEKKKILIGKISPISWIREKWVKLVTGKSSRAAKVTHVDKTCF